MSNHSAISTVYADHDCFSPPTLNIIASSEARWALLGLYGATSFTSLLGNGALILVLLLDKSRSSKASIRNYLLNLALSDILIATIAVPANYANVVLGHWPYPKFVCPLAQIVQVLAVFVTSVTLSVVSVERYIITMHPLSSVGQQLKRNSHFAIAAIWAVGILYATLPLVHSIRTVEFDFQGTVYSECLFDSGLSENLRKLFTLLNFALTFALPLTAISVCYLSIARKLAGDNQRARRGEPKVLFVASTTSSTQQSRSGSSSGSSSKQHKTEEHGGTKIAVSCAEVITSRQSHGNSNSNAACNVNYQRSKIIKLLYTIILSYTVCWLPVKLFQVLLNYQLIGYCSEEEFYRLIAAYIAAHWLAMVSCTANPIIYSASHRRFWRVLKGAFTR